MSLAAGSKLGPYEILGQIGAGGMGEVYRAKDPRLGREVAIKVLPASFSQDADRLRRFEQEAKAAGVLNHPNITAVYDIGTNSGDGAPYVVQELLEGETLRAELAGGKFSPRKAVDYATQIAEGLAAAHEKGIVHRDLKPENLFVTKDGRVKILDFGLAKLTQLEGSGSPVTNLPTETRGTEPGVVLGTLGYMSPEQVRGRSADARSDIFAFGAILYEMLSGQRAFRGDSAADTMSAILKEDPPDLSVTNQNVSPGLERVVRHCLEKNPERRFQSARDLAFDLEAVSGTSGMSAPAAALGKTRRLRGLALAAAATALVASAFWAGRRAASPMQVASAAPGAHKRLTFRRGNVLYARFTADGQNVVYGAAWGDRPAEIFLSHVGSPESRPLGITNASLLSVSSTGELAILLKTTNLFGTVGHGTLARVPLEGGAPRQIVDDAYAADWTPDGKELAVLRRREENDILEFPIGKEIHRVPGGGLTMVRVSPDGGRVAVIDNSDGPALVTIDRAGKRTVLSRDWLFLDSFAWHPSGKEIWAMGVGPPPNAAVGVFAVDLAGRRRMIARTTDIEVLHDIARDGTVLVEREINVREVLFGSQEERAERNLSWLDQSSVHALSSDGRTLLFDEEGEGGGPNGTIYLRPTDGGPALRLGEGIACDLSPDGRWALTRGTTNAAASLILLPTGTGEPKTIPVDGYRPLGASFLPPDGKRLCFAAAETGHSLRGYVLDLAGGKPRAITPEGLSGGAAFSPDGTRIAGNLGPDRRPVIFSIDGSEPRPIPGLEPGDEPIQWGSDGDTLYVTREGEIPQPISRYSLAFGKKAPWKEILPADRAGLIRIENVLITPDGKHYAYSFNRVTNSDLFVVTGWK